MSKHSGKRPSPGNRGEDPNARIPGHQLEVMSTFFIEKLRLKDPVKSAIALHANGIETLKQWTGKPPEQRSRVLDVLAHEGIDELDREKLGKVSREEVLEWYQTKPNVTTNPHGRHPVHTAPLPAITPADDAAATGAMPAASPAPSASLLHDPASAMPTPPQCQSKEEMEDILSSGLNEANMMNALVGLGMRSIYGGVVDFLMDSVSVDVDGASEAEVNDVKREVEIQAKIFRSCEDREAERVCLERLLELHASDAAKVKDTHRRLKLLDRADALANGARACLYQNCEHIEGSDREFQTCSRCKIAVYCSRNCQKLDWKHHSKLCKTVFPEKDEKDLKDP